MKVWIDQDACTGDGLCAEICPEVFGMHDDGLAYVKEVDWKDILHGGTEPELRDAQGLANVPDELLDAVIESAEVCPGECIYIEVE